jgi:hypothetical protein
MRNAIIYFINSKKKVVPPALLHVLIMDIYTLARMMKKYPTNIIVYAGGFHIQHYREFFDSVKAKLITFQQSNTENCVHLAESRLLYPITVRDQICSTFPGISIDNLSDEQLGEIKSHIQKGYSSGAITNLQMYYFLSQ